MMHVDRLEEFTGGIMLGTMPAQWRQDVAMVSSQLFQRDSGWQPAFEIRVQLI